MLEWLVLLVVHAYDLIYGGSQLLVAAAAPPFEALPLQGLIEGFLI
jgi:hypothetical protein